MPSQIDSRLQQEQLSVLKESMVAGMWADQERKKKLEKLMFLIENATFLKKDPQRRKNWIRILHTFDDDFLSGLAQIIIDEDICYKKGQRDTVVELNKLLPQTSSQV